MPVSKTTKDLSFNSTQNRSPCGQWTYGGWTNFIFDSYYKLYNDTISRLKPDPLTDTALPRQYTRRVRPSTIDYPLWIKNYPWTFYECPVGNRTGQINGKTRGIRDSAITSPPAAVLPTVDWSGPLLQYIKDRFVNLGDSLAEYRATASAFSGYAKQMLVVRKKLMSHKRFRTNLSLCSVPLAELGYSFGIAPLVEDVYSSAEALRLKIEAPIFMDFFRTQTGRKKDKPTESGYADITRNCVVSHRVDVRVQLVPLSTPFQFGNPLTWAWAVTPYSFVVDWGIPIGQWLADMDTLRLIQGVSGTRVVKENYQTYFRKTAVNYAGQTVKGTLGKTSLKSHERFLVTSVPVPPFPRWQPSASYHKVWRALTLLIAARGCNPKSPPHLPLINKRTPDRIPRPDVDWRD